MSVLLEVWGDYALFTRPEFKVERTSYDVMTPSAARGILEAIFWHPGMVYRIDKIYVCSPIRFTNLKRNEVEKKISLDGVKKAIKNNEDDKLCLITSDNIAQRSSMVLTNVHYVIKAHFDMTEKANTSDNPGKFQEMLTRRISKGQFYHQPYFGCREFPVNFKLCEEIPTCPGQLIGDKDLGWMLYDMDYSDLESITPKFFRAVMHDGVLELPLWNSEEVRG